MCTGQIHDEWFCCRPYLLSLLTPPKLPMSSETEALITAGTSEHVMHSFSGYPASGPPPSVIIEVQRDYWSRNLHSFTTRFYYFALDEISGLWYEIGTDRWMELRSGMTLHSHVKTFCGGHRVVHSFQTYKSHTTMKELYPDIRLPDQ